jgi:hypothetical protein
VALAGLFLSACNTPPERTGVGITRVNMPAWALSGEHPDFPEAEYIVAFGLDRRMPGAVEAAERGLEVMICRHILASNSELLKGSNFEQVVTNPAAWFGIGEFGNAVRSDSATNGFEAVAVRAITYTELKLRARAMLAQAAGELSAADAPPGGIGTINDRMERWGAYFLLATRAFALELLADNTLNRTAFAKAEQALVALWELPALIRTSELNANQHVRIGGGTDKPLELSAWFRNRPVANVPLLWAPGAGFRGDVRGDTETDEQGRASARVLYLAPTGDDFGYVQAALDLDRAAGNRLGISMPVWLWRLHLPSRDNGELVFRITEDTGYDPVFGPEFKQWCKGRNFNVVDDEPTERPTLHYHVLVEGAPELTLTTRDGTHNAYVSGSFTVRDLETDVVLFRYTLGIEVKGRPGNAESTVALLALREGAAEVLMEMAPRLIATLPGPDDEFGR